MQSFHEKIEARFNSMFSNFAFEADAVRQPTVACNVSAPRGSTRR